MIGMSFGPFLTLLIISFIAAIVMHSLIRYRMMGGFDGFISKWIAAWVGGWLGTPVLGHWWFQIQDVHVIPAFVGAFIGAFSIPFLAKILATTNATAPRTSGSAVVPEMLKKAS